MVGVSFPFGGSPQLTLLPPTADMPVLLTCTHLCKPAPRKAVEYERWLFLCQGLTTTWRQVPRLIARQPTFAPINSRRSTLLFPSADLSTSHRIDHISPFSSATQARKRLYQPWIPTLLAIRRLGTATTAHSSRLLATRWPALRLSMVRVDPR